MSKTNKFVFDGLQIVAWVIFVGLCIEAGALLVNFVFSLYKPEIIQNLYQKMDLRAMYDRSKWAYFSMYSFILGGIDFKGLSILFGYCAPQAN
jgi:hypothetical protein